MQPVVAEKRPNMIESCAMYGCKCDGCGEQWDNGDNISHYVDKELTEQGARDSEWYICEDGKTYCPECWSYDNEDNVVFKKPILPTANDVTKIIFRLTVKDKHKRYDKEFKRN